MNIHNFVTMEFLKSMVTWDGGLGWKRMSDDTNKQTSKQTDETHNTNDATNTTPPTADATPTKAPAKVGFGGRNKENN